MVKLKRNMLSIALMSATLLVVGTAQAQSQQEQAARDKASTEEGKKESDKDAATEIDKVTVTGIRTGIEDAIETKKDNSQIVEAISAEDIGKLPDSSIAESIARLPGVTAQRERGRATQIQIRGFAGDFATTLLNGREQASTSDNRSAEFDQYPSELLSQVVIYKTADATLVGQGLSGTVDLQTIDPLSYDDRVISMQYRYDQNENNGDTESGSRYSFAYIDQFMDNKLGISIGYAHMDSPQPGFQNEAWGYPCLASVPDPKPDNPGNKRCGNGSVADGGVTDPYVLGGAKVYKFDSSFERDGFAGTIQFKPNDFYETSFDAFYSTFDKSELKSGLEFGTVWGSGQLQPGYTIGENNTITNSDWTGVTPVIRMDSNPINNTVQSYGWNNIFTFNEDWKMIVDLSTSETESKFSLLETYAGLVGNGKTTLGVDLAGDYNNFTFGTDLGNPANLELINAGNWGDGKGQDGYLKDFEVKDTLDAYRLDFVRSFSDGGISSIEFGVNYTDRSKSKSSDEYILCINQNVNIDGCGANRATAPYPGTTQSFGVGGIPTLATFDPRQLLNSGFYTLVSKNHPDIANKNWQVDETLTTWYAQANIDSEFGNGARLTGNVGFQYVDVDQSSTAYATYSGAPAGQLLTNGASYGDFLPSINLNLNFAENHFIRGAIAQQMARPRMDAMRASYDVSIADTTCNGVPGPVWCGGGGNPELKPWLATAYDLSYEWYFTSDAGKTGYLSAAYFYKDLETYIYYANVPYDFAGDPLPPPGPGSIPGVNYPASTVGVLNQPINGSGGYMKGYELTASVPLDALWNPLEGFGIQATYSSNESNIEPFPGSNQPIPGLSEDIWNATVYWERWGWSVRYSARYRSDFRGETRGFGADLSVIDISEETVQDAQINYTFHSGALENLSFYLQMSNIGDEPFRSDAGQNRPISYFEYGRQTLIGVSYKF